MSQESISQAMMSPALGSAIEAGSLVSATEASAPELDHHLRVRPWGIASILEEGGRFRINRIEIAPGQHISTQMHYHRSEHWVVVSGTAKVTCGDREQIIFQNQSTYVPKAMPHRVENPGVIPLVIIEVQNGEYLGEDDITRFEPDPTEVS
jgi:mannose-6-phosphate isomerase-like protein (cupin superfamily)